MSHSNSSMAHEFYYYGVDGGHRKAYRNCTISYDGNVARSYYTAVAKVIPARGRRPSTVTTHEVNSGLTLVSFYPMSSTTASHISLLRYASPFPTVRVPMRMGRGDFSPHDLRDELLEALDDYSQAVNKADSRRAIVELLESRREILNRACEAWAKPLRDRRFRKFETMDLDKAAEELKERNRRAGAKRAAETRKLFAKYLPKAKAGGADYCEFVRTLCDRQYFSERFPLGSEQRAQLRSKLSKGADYVWPDGDRIRTSRGISVDVNEARVLMRLWALGKDMRKMEIGHYTIVKYEGDTIKIGCHNIPRENMLALYEVLMGEPFPTAKTEGGEVGLQEEST